MLFQRKGAFSKFRSRNFRACFLCLLQFNRSLYYPSPWRRSHEEYGDIIDEGAPDHQLATLFGTKTGIDALAEFVKKKQGLPENTSRGDPLEDPRCRPCDLQPSRPARPDRNLIRSTLPNENLTLKACEQQ